MHYQIRCFDECLKHSAKLKKHSAKSLPSVALGKGFFAEYFFSGTRHSLCRVPDSTRQRKAAVTALG
jgi:hypothetical protein